MSAKDNMTKVGTAEAGEGILEIYIPQIGATNWADEIEEYCFKLIAEHNHNGDLGGRIVNSSNLTVSKLKSKTNAEQLQNSSDVLPATVDVLNPDDKNISSESQPIIELGTNGAAQIDYSLRNNASNRSGTLFLLNEDGNSGCITDEFIGDTIPEVVFSINGGKLQATLAADSGNFDFNYVVRETSF